MCGFLLYFSFYFPQLIPQGISSYTNVQILGQNTACLRIMCTPRYTTAD